MTSFCFAFFVFFFSIFFLLFLNPAAFGEAEPLAPLVFFTTGAWAGGSGGADRVGPFVLAVFGFEAGPLAALAFATAGAGAAGSGGPERPGLSALRNCFGFCAAGDCVHSDASRERKNPPDIAVVLFFALADL